jgi:peptidyl-prolyl cis-trans isomerase B (cyclophilin B)
VGTPKRDRQKANRQARLEELARQARSTKRKRTSMYVLLIPLAAVAIAGIAWALKRGNDNPAASDTSSTTSIDANVSTTSIDPNAPTTTVVAVRFAYGTGECPAVDGSSAKTQKFAAPPKLCIDPAKTYTAKVVTNKGDFTVAFDAAKAPGTVNNFVVLARYHYFDDTICHRILENFVAQCGDPTGTGGGDPGYKIPDELPAGPYAIGDLAMANSSSPDTGGSQFFVITGANGAALPPQYSLFGHVTDGLDTTVKAIAAAAAAADPAPPKEKISIQSVTITES